MTDQGIKDIASNVVETLAKIEESFRLAKLELLKKESELFRPLYAKREKITSAIPRFWSTVLSIEDELAPYIKEGEADLLKSCTSFKIARLDDPRNFSLTMKFSQNEYLKESSSELVKMFVFDGGRLTSEILQLNWKDGKDLVKAAAQEDRLSFFSLFSFVGHSEDQDMNGQDEIDDDDPQIILEDMAMLLADEVYPHALSYFTDALAPPDTPAESPFLSGIKQVGNGTETPHLALESMTTSFLDQQERVVNLPKQNGVEGGKTHQLASTPGLEKYCTTVGTPLDSLLINHRKETIAQDFSPTLMITENQAQFLAFLTQTIRPKRVLEIGTFTGLSALVMTQCDAIQELITLEQNPQNASFAKLAIHGAGKADIISVLVGDAHRTLDEQITGKFDLIFIDAEKSGYQAYMDTILQRGLLERSGTIILDNTLRRGHVVGTTPLPARLKAVESPAERTKNDTFERDVEAVVQFNRQLAAQQELEVVLLPVYDGITLVRYK